MTQHTATISWKNEGPNFLRGQYSREHIWTFDGGVTVPASASPHGVPAPWSNAASVDPEEAFVASVASCHLLTFVWLASRAGFLAESYLDEAVGVMSTNERGAKWVGTVKLRPRIVWGGTQRPTPAEVAELHHRAHEECFIANSIKTEVVVETP